MKTILFTICTLAIGAAMPSATAQNRETGSPPRTSEAIRELNLVETIHARPELGTFSRLLKLSGMEEILGNGDFTVLAPTDAAFQAMPEENLEALLASGNRTQLQQFVGYHVIPARIPAARLGTGEATTLQGSKIAFSTVDGVVWVSRAEVMKADIPAGSGLIHTLTMVLEPDIE